MHFKTKGVNFIIAMYVEEMYVYFKKLKNTLCYVCMYVMSCVNGTNYHYPSLLLLS